MPFPLKDGGAMAMYASIKAWHDAGKKVHLLLMNTSRHRVAMADLPPLFAAIGSVTMVEMNTDIKPTNLLRNVLLSRKPEHAERFYSKYFEEILRSKIEEIKPDVVQLESIYLHEYSTAIRKLSKAFIVQRLHNIEAQVWHTLATQSHSFWKRQYLFLLAKRIAQYEQKVWNESDALLPISKKDQDFIITKGIKTPQLLLPFGIDLLHVAFADFPTDAPWNAYHIGAMDWLPNADAMQWMSKEIVPAILEKAPDFHFEFAGRNMPQNFKKFQEKSFRCAGEVADAQTFLKEKQILIVPLRSGSGIRVKTLEAMAMGKLVISTNIGIEGIEAIDKVHYLKANTASEFADAIHWVVHNKNAARIIAHNAQLLIMEQYNQARLTKKLVDFVENL